MAETKDELPVLPEPCHRAVFDDAPFFTPTQMHAFRQEGVAAAQSRINALLEEVEGLRKLARAVIQELDDPPDAPGHCHTRRGIWDEDNGSRSGNPCQWCATWRAFKAAAAVGEDASLSAGRSGSGDGGMG